MLSTLLCIVCICLWGSSPISAQAVDASLFSVSNDVPQQRQALLQLLQAVGSTSDIQTASLTLTDLGYPGTSPWGAANVSYCWWWGVSCCGQPLTTDLQICREGLDSGQSISGIELPAVGLKGTLPDVFGNLPDLQVLDVSYNRGERMFPADFAKRHALQCASRDEYLISCSPE